ncbi:MAG: 50S ribosomal protein L25/general stress protein Ctc [Gammaproteobacteria bacterium CG22_combo_CG10-13_8_21_14_all_40_8]|nr:MAG: 50S ribosomal protein L25/general stress protein Ctc [Gammaproteobacteria bacterium CG22_combo_CG10-13_8_21_14_all_40_8]
MSEQFEIHAELRQDQGKGASRRLRHENKMPAVVYGAGKEALSLVLSHNEIFHALENEAFYSHIINLHIGKKKEKVLLKALQRHPFKPTLIHADFLRVDAKEALTTHVPIHWVNENSCYGVKSEGGQLSHLKTDLEICCLPKDLPEFIEVDVAGLKLGETIHLSDIKMPANVSILAIMHDENHTHNLGVVTVVKSKAAPAEETAE